MDHLIVAMTTQQDLRIVVARTTDAVQEAALRQQAQPSERVVLGRALTAGCLMATLAKGDKERLRLQFVGNGPVEQVIVDAHGDGKVRACFKRPLGSPTHLLARFNEKFEARPDVGVLLGARGYVTVVRDLGMSQPYEGSSELISGEIDEDLELYLLLSEQLPSAVRCETFLDERGQISDSIGVLVQAMPGSDPARIQEVRDRLSGGQLWNLARDHINLDALVQYVVGGSEHAVIDRKPRPLAFHCPCGPTRARSVLSTLGAQDLEALAQEREEIEVACNFCGKIERLSSSEILDLAADLRSARS